MNKYLSLDEVAAKVRRYDAEGTSRARGRLIHEIALRYGVTLYPYRHRPDVILGRQSDLDYLNEAVMADQKLDALGRGYYLYAGGEFTAWVIPDWACNPATVSWLRLRVLMIDRWVRPLVRALSRHLAR